MHAHLELVWDSRSPVTESPVWDERNDRLLFADLEAGKIMALGLTDGSRQSWDLRQKVGSFGLCRSGRFVVALHRRVALFNPLTGKLEDLSPEMQEPATSGFNDGKVGPDGCFWVGGRDGRPKQERQPISSLYRVSPDGTMEIKAHGYRVCNGLAWSPEGRTMFHSDSSSARIDIWDFDHATGNNTNQRTLVQQTDADGRHHGHTCTDGCTAGASSRYFFSGWWDPRARRSGHFSGSGSPGGSGVRSTFRHIETSV